MRSWPASRPGRCEGGFYLAAGESRVMRRRNLMCPNWLTVSMRRRVWRWLSRRSSTRLSLITKATRCPLRTQPLTEASNAGLRFDPRELDNASVTGQIPLVRRCRQRIATRTRAPVTSTRETRTRPLGRAKVVCLDDMGRDGPPLLVAVTSTRMVCPRSARWTRYVRLEAAKIGTHPLPRLRQSSHW